MTGGEAERWLEAAAEQARLSRCVKRRCGTVIVGAAGEIIGAGFNGLPGGEGDACVHCQPYALGAGFKSDKTCCIHAEQRAVMDALKRGAELSGSTLYFTSVDEAGMRLASGKPYCTICSKMALDAGVGFWVLEHELGPKVYEAAAYNALSFEYGKESE